VIARAIFQWDHGDCATLEQWAEEHPSLRAAYFRSADAVIDAMESMEVTEKMEDAYWDAIGFQEIWRAMVRAMRDE